MSAPTFFIGVVSHRSTRFPISQGPEGPAHLLARHLEGLGFQCEVQINTENLWDLAMREGSLQPEWNIRLDRRAVQRSLTAQLQLEHLWSAFLSESRSARWLRRQAVLGAGRIWRFLLSPQPAYVRRLLNIEWSHLDLWRAGVASGASWIVILEDDALAEDVADLAAGLVGFREAEGEISFINLSRSFTQSALGTQHLLRLDHSHPWCGKRTRSVVASAKPITNTVCAIAHQRDFVVQLLDVWNGLPADPVVPIDWKLNAALMRLVEEVAPLGACLTVEPAPVLQGSMITSGSVLPEGAQGGGAS